MVLLNEHMGQVLLTLENEKMYVETSSEMFWRVRNFCKGTQSKARMDRSNQLRTFTVLGEMYRLDFKPVDLL